MILTERQKNILTLLLNSSDGITIKEIGKRIQISRRTVSVQ